MKPEIIFTIATFLSMPLILASVIFARRQVKKYFLESSSDISLRQLLRRLAASALTIIISIMLFTGSNFINAPSEPIDFLNFWGLWLLLVLLLFCLLIWDWLDTSRFYFKKRNQYRDQLIEKSFGKEMKKITLSKENIVYFNDSFDDVDEQ